MVDKIPPWPQHSFGAHMDLLLLHGALGSKRQMVPLQQRVGGAVMDFTGHGERQIPATGLTFTQFVEDIDRAYAANRFTKAHLFGYSMGGYAALLYAAQFPVRVFSVTTLGTKLVWTEEGLQKELRMLDPEKMQTKVPAFAKALADMHGVDRWSALVVGHRGKHERTGGCAVAHAASMRTH
ncbi:MAG: alpha/beta fold hydrolase [Flavobacteriales bacterium]|nr:alpha/beta fold hydrolase [Flavobacteriales bacterium]